MDKKRGNDDCHFRSLGQMKLSGVGCHPQRERSRSVERREGEVNTITFIANFLSDVETLPRIESVESYIPKAF